MIKRYHERVQVPGEQPLSFKLLDSGWSDELEAGMREKPETVLIVCPFIIKRTVERLISNHQPHDLRLMLTPSSAT